MKAVIIILSCLTSVSYSQFVPHSAAINVSKTEIVSTEVFTVSYELSGVDGYVYVALMDDYLESIGPSRWEGQIDWAEVKTLRFSVRLKHDRILGLGAEVPIRIAFSYKPIGSVVAGG